MKLSTIFELLLIFLLIAFAAYGRVIDSNSQASKKLISKQTSAAPISLKQATENVNKYCVCNENICNCCRDFHIPLVQLSGPGCASLQYLQDNKLAMQLSIGDNILSSNIVNGNNPKPVCVNLPGGFSKFCGKIYSIKKEADKHFKACLGLELRSASELEASLRVSCFRFGPDGLKLRPAEPLPPTLSVPSNTNADDDYDDIFGLDEDDEDDDEDDEETENDDFEKLSAQNPSPSSLSTEQENQEQTAAEEDDEDDDLLGLSALLDIFTSDDESTTTNKKTRPTSSTPLPTSFTIPILALTSTSSPALDTHSSGSSGTSILNKVPTTTTSTSTERIIETISDTTAVSNDQTIDTDTVKTLDEGDAETSSAGITEINSVPLQTETIENGSYGKKSKVNSTELKQINKKPVGITSTKVHNTTNIKKIGTKPAQIVDDSTEADDSSESIYDDDQDDEDDEDDEDNDDTKKNEAENETNKTANSEGAETSADVDYDQSYESDEDEDEDEDADVQVMSTLLEDEISTEKTKHHKVKNNKTTKVGNAVPAKSDYDYELSEILGREYSNTINKKGVKRKVAHNTK